MQILTCANYYVMLCRHALQGLYKSHTAKPGDVMSFDPALLNAQIPLPANLEFQSISEDVFDKGEAFEM